MRHSLIALLLAASACGRAPGDAGRLSGAASVPLTVTLRIGGSDADAPDAFADIRGLAVDSAGRIYVLEAESHEVRVFDTAGTFVRRWGRKGHGPAEFGENYPAGLRIDAAQHLWVVDQGNGRFTSFSLDGNYLSTVTRLFPGSFVSTWEGAVHADGSITDVVNRFSPKPAVMLFHMPAGAAVVRDSMLLPVYEGEAYEISRPGMSVRAGVPFTPSQRWVLDRSDAIWIGTTDAIALVRLSFKGDTLARIRLPHTPVKVAAEERTAALAGFDWFTKQGGTVDPSRIPDHKPAFRRLAVDDANRLWIQLEVEGPADTAVFAIFDSTGTRVGGAAGSLGRLHGDPLIQGGHLYAVVADSDGVQSVVRAVVAQAIAATH
jgi:hypothetical protein